MTYIMATVKAKIDAESCTLQEKQTNDNFYLILFIELKGQPVCLS